MSKSVVGNSFSNNGLGHNPPEGLTPLDRSLFRVGDALLETAIAVTSVRVAHADCEQEHDAAFAELQDRWSQRERAR